MFDLYNINTYDEVPDSLAVIDGEIIYDDKGNPLKLKDFTNLIKAILKFLNRNGDNITLNKEQIHNVLYRFTSKYKEEIKNNKSINPDIIYQNEINKYSEKTSKIDFSEVIKSDLIINGYQFSIAQKEMMKYLNDQQKIKLTEIIQNHFINKEKSYRLQQDIFDYQIPIDNDLFKDLCYCKYLDDEKEIMEEYYSSFDTIENIDELNEVLDNDYLNYYPDLKAIVRERLINNLDLQ